MFLQLYYNAPSLAAFAKNELYVSLTQEYPSSVYAPEPDPLPDELLLELELGLYAASIAAF